MFPILIQIGPFTLYTYGFFLFTGVIFAYLLGKKRAQEVKIEKKVYGQLFFWALLAGIIGSRAGYIIINWQRFQESPFEMILNRGGFAFFGGLILALIFLLFLAKKNRINFFKITDLFSLCMPLAHAFGRLGCFFNGCCHGIPTQSWLGVKFPLNSAARLPEVKVIPTQLIEAIFLLFLFFLLYRLRPKMKKTGMLTAGYLIGYSFFRFIIEFFRDDAQIFFNFLSVAQLISVGALLLALIILKRKNA